MAEEWPSGCDEDQFFSDPPRIEPTHAMPADAGGEIRENLYCLGCGYNLRGLSGDPVRCPECGEQNDLGIVRIPAQNIEMALRQMETTPTTSVVLFLLALLLLILVPFVQFSGRFACAIFAAVCVIGWSVAIRRTRIEFDDQPGWQTILFRFHLAATLFVFETTFVVLANAHLNQHGFGSGNYLPIMPAVAGLPCIVIALRIYKTARNDLRRMQQARAMSIAHHTLRKLMRGRQFMLGRSK